MRYMSRGLDDTKRHAKRGGRGRHTDVVESVLRRRMAKNTALPRTLRVCRSALDVGVRAGRRPGLSRGKTKAPSQTVHRCPSRRLEDGRSR